MIIYPIDRPRDSFADAVAGMKFSPSVGDDGHVQDHGRLAKILFDAVHSDIPVAIAQKEGGSWTITQWAGAFTAESATFAEVREYGERVGIRATGDPGDAWADGETDWAVDSEALDGAFVTFHSSGLVGVAYATANVLLTLSDIAERLDALEAAQA